LRLPLALSLLWWKKKNTSNILIRKKRGEGEKRGGSRSNSRPTGCKGGGKMGDEPGVRKKKKLPSLKKNKRREGQKGERSCRTEKDEEGNGLKITPLYVHFIFTIKK